MKINVNIFLNLVLLHCLHCTLQFGLHLRQRNSPMVWVQSEKSKFDVLFSSSYRKKIKFLLNWNKKLLLPLVVLLSKLYRFTYILNELISIQLLPKRPKEHESFGCKENLINDVFLIWRQPVFVYELISVRCCIIRPPLLKTNWSVLYN